MAGDEVLRKKIHEMFASQEFADLPPRDQEFVQYGGTWEETLDRFDFVIQSGPRK